MDAAPPLHSGVPARSRSPLFRSFPAAQAAAKAALDAAQATQPAKPMTPAKATAPAKPEPEWVRLCGVVRRILHHAPGSGFTALVLRTKEGEVKVQGWSRRRIGEGERLAAEGSWGLWRGKRQFKAEMLRRDGPVTPEWAMEWLFSSIPDLPDAKARYVAHSMGRRLPDLLGDLPALMQAGLTHELAETVSNAWRLELEAPELEARLRRLGLSPQQALQAVGRFGIAVHELLDSDPWQLSDIGSIGFRDADTMARANGFSDTSQARLRAGMRWVLAESIRGQGHCGLPEGRLVAAAARALDVPEALVQEAFPGFANSSMVTVDGLTGLVFPTELLRAEEQLVRCLLALLSVPPSPETRQRAAEAVAAAERSLGVELDRDGGQFEAAVMAASCPIAVITGGPGTGKSTTQAVIVVALEMMGLERERIRLAAPTGRAARRLAEVSGREAWTLHRVLDFDPAERTFRRGPQRPLDMDYAIVDEFSMVDVLLAAAFVQAIPVGGRLLMVGDVDQLPSVGPGQVLRDLIASGRIPVTRLTRVHRQAAGSGIAIAAAQVNVGEAPEAGEDVRDFRIEDCSDPALFEATLETLRFQLPEEGFDPLRDVQVITSMRRGDLGTEQLNLAIKAALNPARDDGSTVTIGSLTLTVDDRVMQVRNDYGKGVYNGEVGRVTAVGIEVQPNGKQRAWVTADFSGVEARYLAEDACDIELAYAVTVHKVQGCEATALLFLAPRAHRHMLTRNLFYTGITRGQSLVIVMGDRRTLAAAPRNESARLRLTGLQQRLGRGDMLTNNRQELDCAA